MKKRSRKLISILLTLSLLVTLLVPLATPASAVVGSADSISALTTPTTKDDTTTKLGTILIKTVAGAAYNGNVFTVRLPADYEFPATYNGTFSGTGGLVSAPSPYDGDNNAFVGSTFDVNVINDNEIHVKVNNPIVDGNPGFVLVKLEGITVPSGADKGDIKAIVTSPASQGFPSGEVAVGKIVGGEVLVSVDETKTFIDTSSDITLRFKETVGASFDATTKSMKLRLPNGFTWGTPGTPSLIWGDSNWLLNPSVLVFVNPFTGVQTVATDTNADGSITVADTQTYTSGSETETVNAAAGLTFRVDGRDLYLQAGRKTAGGTYFGLPVSVQVDDESVAKFGDVTVSFSGDTDAVPTELVIAKYNDMGSTVTAANATTVVAGKIGEEIGDVVIEETAPDTFSDTRTITLTLPSTAKWSAAPSIDEDGISASLVGFVGSDGRTLKYKIDAHSTGDPGTLKFEDGEVMLSGDASGKLEVEVAGTAGAEGKVEVAEIKAPVTAAAGTAPELKIGLNEQSAADLTITELETEAIDNQDLEINLPTGVEWSDVPTIEVTDGDVDLDEATTSAGTLRIPVKATSSKVATIKISNIKLDVDRTVAEGDIYAKVGGMAVNEVNDEATIDETYDESGNYWVLADVDGNAFRYHVDGAFPNVTNVAKAVIAKVGTPAPVDQKKSAKFVINDTKFTVNGVEYTMDVAPYVKDGRTFLPVRFVAQALGVADSNILWDAATQKVTLLKNGTVVQLTIGSKVMLVNGSAITMDVAPELTSDRTMLPFRAIAQAFGASVGWDEATQTVTMEL